MRVPRQFALGRAARLSPLGGRMPCVVSMLQVRLRFGAHGVRSPFAFLLPLFLCGLLLSLFFSGAEPLTSFLLGPVGASFLLVSVC